jgi:hypothetical protein
MSNATGFDAQRLLQLLPAVYSWRDREQAAVSPGWLPPEERQDLATLQGLVDDGFVLTPAQQQDLDRLRERALAGPLASLLAVFAEQIAVLDEDLSQLYDDQFIDTCAEWVVPYIGDLIGYRHLHNVSATVGRARAEVAHTIGFRRRKGTLAVLEQLAFDVTGWKASAGEFFQRLVLTQYMNHPRLHCQASPDLRQWEPLARVNSAFDRIPRTPDVRRIEPRRGRHNIPNIGLFTWRLTACPLTRSPAARVDTRRHRFHPLNIDAPLFTRPDTETGGIGQLAQPLNVPMPIARRVLAERLASYHGPQRSLRLHLDRDDGAGLLPLATGDVHVCHLGDDAGSWAHLPAANGPVAVDPVLGRIALPPEATDDWRVVVDVHHGFPADLGGGEYEREAGFEAPTGVQQLLRVPDDRPTIQQALDDLGGDGIVEITDSGRYEELLAINVAAGGRIEVRAADHRRPTLVLGGAWTLRGGADARVRLDGLLVTGHRLEVPAGGGNALATLSLAHCTLVPGWTLDADALPQSPAEASLRVALPDLALTMQRCISGPLRLPEDASAALTDCIVDATRVDGLAYAAPGEGPGAALTLRACTVVGRVRAHRLPLVSNSILLAQPAAVGEAPVRATLRQQGCVRFSWLPPASRTPRRHRCLPESAPTPQSAVPRFTTLRYGRPAYAQLADSAGPRLLTGADDEAEPGAYHHLFNAWRDSNLRLRLDEYLRVGLQAGIFHES